MELVQDPLQWQSLMLLALVIRVNHSVYIYIYIYLFIYYVDRVRRLKTVATSGRIFHPPSDM
jgi:hypothetical protein